MLIDTILLDAIPETKDSPMITAREDDHLPLPSEVARPGQGMHVGFRPRVAEAHLVEVETRAHQLRVRGFLRDSRSEVQPHVGYRVDEALLDHGVRMPIQSRSELSYEIGISGTLSVSALRKRGGVIDLLVSVFVVYFICFSFLHAYWVRGGVQKRPCVPAR